MIRANSFLGGKSTLELLGNGPGVRFKKPFEDKKDPNENRKVLNKELDHPGAKKPLEDQMNLENNGKVLKLE